MGIGVIAPQDKLDVTGVTQIAASDSSGRLMLSRYSATYPWSILQLGPGSDSFRLRSAADTDLFYVASSSNVGIGTTAPGAKLDVGGGVRLANDAGTCDSSKAGTIRWTGSAFEGCIGTAWLKLTTVSDGTSAASAGRNCFKILSDIPTSASGIYWLDPTGSGSPFQAYCDMITDGGGWTLVMRMANDSTLGYSSAYWASGSLLNSASLDATSNSNAVYQSYSTVSGTTIRGCKGANTLCIQGTVGSTNAKTLFSGSTQTLSISRASFIATFPPDDTSQPNCNQAGINVGVADGWGKFAIVGNNENDCGSDDSAWGWGIRGAGSHYCGAGTATWNSGSYLYTCSQGTLWIR